MNFISIAKIVGIVLIFLSIIENILLVYDGDFDLDQALLSCITIASINAILVYGSQNKNKICVTVWIAFIGLDILFKTYLCTTLQMEYAGFLALIVIFLDIFAIIVAHKAIKQIENEESKRLSMGTGPIMI